MINFWIVLKGGKGSPIIQRIGKQAVIISVLFAYVYETDNCERDKSSNFYFHRISKYIPWILSKLENYTKPHDDNNQNKTKDWLILGI
jgi:hypothetical protein